MTAPGPAFAPIVPAAPAAGSAQGRIAAFASRSSFEAIRLTEGDVETLASAFPRGTAVYLSDAHSQPRSAQIEAAAQLSAAGFEPVPHIAARSFASAGELDGHLGALAERARVKRVLVIGGDVARPAGPFHAAGEVVESGLLQARGIVEIGIAAYPQGHPRLGTGELERARVAKIAAAAETGLAVHIVTQFCFSAPAILAFVTRLRDLGIDYPVSVGLAGPATLAALMRYARICGVTASAQGLARHAGLAKHAFGLTVPDALLRPLAEASAGLGDVVPHIFSFGGLATAARWAGATAAGRITLDRSEGFSVAPP
jgi:methylenetetrahydrofolate reductase (NADPH)